MGGMRRIGAVVLTAVLGLGLVACGSDSKDDASGTTTEADVSGDVAASAFAGDCAAFVNAFAGAGASVGSAFSGTSDAADLEKVAEYFEEVADKLPKDIRADFQIFAQAYADFAKAMAEANIDFSNPASMNPEALAELEKLGKAFEDSKVQEASDRVQAYVDANCKGS